MWRLLQRLFSSCFSQTQPPLATTAGLMMLLVAPALVSQNVSAQQLPVDTSIVELRTVPEDELAAYRADAAFEYDERLQRDESSASSLFWRRVGQLIDRFFASGLGRPLLWLIAIGTLLFVISLMIGTSPRSVFYRRSNHRSTAIVEQDLHITNFEALIDAAVRRDDYREAVRLRFVRALRNLSDQKQIRWTREKTNRMYLYELSRSENGRDLAGPFREITRWFDYCWYGHAAIDQEMYRRIDAAYLTFENRINSGPSIVAT